ncbi:MAG TPA: hypothetical protein VNL96_06775, partial [Gemmatimonadaceae bacterium]|nr:hypothetical protein [Gemmatimonadaceae bacterium]
RSSRCSQACLTAVEQMVSMLTGPISLLSTWQRSLTEALRLPGRRIWRMRLKHPRQADAQDLSVTGRDLPIEVLATPHQSPVSRTVPDLLDQVLGV